MRLLLLGLAACGFTGKDLPGDASRDAPLPADGAPLDGPMIDGGPALSCVEKWHAGGAALALSAPVALGIANTAQTERDPFLSKDASALYFNRNGATWQIAIVGGVFGIPVQLAYVDGANNPITGVSKLSILDDNATAVVSVANPQDNFHTDVAFFGRQPDGTTFKRLGPIAAASNPNVDDYDPEVTPDGLALYWAPGGLGSPNQQIHVVARAKTSDMFPPTGATLTELGADNHADPTVDGEQRILLYSTQTDGGAIEYAVRDAVAQPWMPKGEVPVINTAANNEGDPHLSFDACTVYFARFGSGTQDWDLYLSSVL